MRATIITGGVLVCIALIGGVYYVVQGDGERAASRTGQEAPSLNALVTSLSDPVSLKHATGTDFQKIEKTARAGDGSVVRTGEQGRALIEISSTTRASVDFNSEFSIERADADTEQTRIALLAGQVWSRVEKTLEQGGFYEIETQNGVATVRGTSFNVAYEDDETRITVADGTVSVAKRDPDTGQVQFDTARSVEAGQTAHVRDDEPVRVRQTPSEILQSDWYARNTTETDTDDAPRQSDEETEQSEQQPQESETDTQTQNQQEEPQETQPSDDGDTTDTAVFAVTEMSTTDMTLRDGESDTLTLYGTELDSAVAVLIGEYRIEQFSIRSSERVEVTLPYEIPDGTYSVFVIGDEGDGQIASAPSELTISHVDTVDEEQEEQPRG